MRKQDIIKVTEQLIEAISNGDFENYTYVIHKHTSQSVVSVTSVYSVKAAYPLSKPLISPQ